MLIHPLKCVICGKREGFLWCIFDGNFVCPSCSDGVDKCRNCVGREWTYPTPPVRRNVLGTYHAGFCENVHPYMNHARWTKWRQTPHLIVWGTHVPWEVIIDIFTARGIRPHVQRPLILVHPEAAGLIMALKLLEFMGVEIKPQPMVR